MRVIGLRCFDMPSLYRESTNLVEHVVYPMITCSRTVFRHACPIRSIYVLNYTRQVETYVLSCIRIFIEKIWVINEGSMKTVLRYQFAVKRIFEALFHNY